LCSHSTSNMRLHTMSLSLHLSRAHTHTHTRARAHTHIHTDINRRACARTQTHRQTDTHTHAYIFLYLPNNPRRHRVSDREAIHRRPVRVRGVGVGCCFCVWVRIKKLFWKSNITERRIVIKSPKSIESRHLSLCSLPSCTFSARLKTVVFKCVCVCACVCVCVCVLVCVWVVVYIKKPNKWKHVPWKRER
jgi:hypothetical protein